MHHRPARLLTGLVASAALVLPAGVAIAPAANAEDTTTTTVVESTETAAYLGLSEGLWSHLDEATRARLTELTALIPDQRTAPADPDIVESQIRDSVLAAIEAAINPGDYQCSTTPLDGYIDGLVDEFFDQGKIGHLIILLLLTNALDYPTYDALFHGSPGDPDYAILPEYVDPLALAFKKADRFWDVDTSDVKLFAMQGDMLADVDRVEAMVRYFGNATPGNERALAEQLVFLAGDAPRGYDNPLYTLNAYAFTAEGDPDPDVQDLSDRLVFGDGILRALEGIGLSDAGPQAVMGHEFGHHVQYELDHAFPGTPEGTRHTELEADAMATYFVTNKKGMARNERRVVNSIVAFYAVGDCSFDSPGHHGTPNQRRKAAEWGAGLARQTAASAVLSSATVVSRFEAQLPTILLPDAQ
jgi:hypothetical protein